ncbi:LysM peptidoglycan-binding domain-containing protein [Corallococcus sp. CA047B]|uniref:LysM peptidoglycan-binding domain-containing protein n=1 Tax=Corallococcus sp. CA047B TaxID=2316729 RepID=UPI000EA12749|nr:LysM peptidoglycan-binding domain-containing protein [Corallococcus sp. CA047B]RKH21036.1 LysM peptidoglycan-binding domain-containing protein [Corallococcus sp. CA047B]
MGSTIQPNSGANASRTTFKPVAATVPPPAANATTSAAPRLAAATDSFESQPSRKQAVNLTGGPPVVTVMPAVDLAPKPATYTVQEGDTGYAIAHKLGVSLEALRNANPQAGGLGGGTGGFLSIGDTLTIPSGTTPSQAAPVAATPATVVATPVTPQPATEATAAPAVVAPDDAAPPAQYTVVAGDNASIIAAKLGVSVQALLSENGSAEGLVAGSGKFLQVGQRLDIPEPPPPPLAQAPTGSPDLNAAPAMTTAGEANQESFGPDSADPTRYDGRCLSFVADTAVQAGLGDPILSQPNAATALYEAQRQGRLYTDMSNMPEGAIVFWQATGKNGDQGHVAIYLGKDENGADLMLTSTGFGESTGSGVQVMTLDQLTGLESVEPAGWMMPR